MVIVPSPSNTPARNMSFCCSDQLLNNLLTGFSFFINIVRPQKRFAKWSKTEHHDDLECIVQYFDYSYEKAKVVMDILSAEDIDNIKKKLEKGGLKK